jgi:cytochrome c-type biogenesis protein CcmH/NrfF
MQHLTTEQKAKEYNRLLHQYQRIQEEVRLIKAQNVNVSDSDQMKINKLEDLMKHVYSQTEKLYR